MDFAKGVSTVLGWLKGASYHLPLPPRPPVSSYKGYSATGILEVDPGEAVVIEIIDDRSAEEFLYFGVRVSTPQSSNVAQIWYEAESFKLFVMFKNTCVYEYLDITVELAYAFFTAFSKGQWVWDNLRTLRRAYQFLYSLTGHIPRRMEDPAATGGMTRNGWIDPSKGSLAILGRDPFAFTKSAVRVRIKYELVKAYEKKVPKFARHANHSYQFVHMKRTKAGLNKIRSIIRGRK